MGAFFYGLGSRDFLPSIIVNNFRTLLQYLLLPLSYYTADSPKPTWQTAGHPAGSASSLSQPQDDAR